MYDNLIKYTNPSWNEVLTEQGRQLPCSGNSRNTFKKQNWETQEQFNKRLFYFEFGNNKKVIQAYEKIFKYGYPKKCPIINKITNLIIF